MTGSRAGPLLVLAEVVYSITDPPLRALRKVLKPVRVGAMSLDLAFIALFLLVSILMQVNRVVFYSAFCEARARSAGRPARRTRPHARRVHRPGRIRWSAGSRALVLLSDQVLRCDR